MSLKPAKLQRAVLAHHRARERVVELERKQKEIRRWLAAARKKQREALRRLERLSVEGNETNKGGR